MKYKIAALALAAVIIYSCKSSSTATATTEAKPNVVATTASPTVLTPELMEGKSLYENNCAKCHRLYDTKEFSAEDWKPIVARMQKKAHLDDIAGQKIYNYVSMK
ncbi:MAG TPA: c-type cytochrome [Flavobacterium sp.]|uniref:c-type cytochrome n=1 Tax=Flavobacterium sp. TaxID=239 RepID=UPI002C1EACDB|nr:c-type cytochrome [Flavobacterium sp.]HNP32603.1 c-type cytochrome [Flavobacterium sp.]